MMRVLMVVASLLLSVGCKSAPKSAQQINIAKSSTLFMLIADYSERHGKMPANLYMLDLSGIGPVERQATIEDFRSVSQDRKQEADFLYFGAPCRLEQLDSDRIILASPFPGTFSEGRRIVRADGEGGFLSESQFQQTLIRQANREKAEGGK
ncbi:MAG: hypothetical protein QM627_11235 [Luteolibacter sp.]